MEVLDPVTGGKARAVEPAERIGAVGSRIFAISSDHDAVGHLIRRRP
jgi:hypothetical protein